MNFFKFSKFSKFLVCLSFSLMFSGFSTYGMDGPMPLTPETVEPENRTIDDVKEMLKNKFKDRVIVYCSGDIQLNDIDFNYLAQIIFNERESNNCILDSKTFTECNILVLHIQEIDNESKITKCEFKALSGVSLNGFIKAVLLNKDKILYPIKYPADGLAEKIETVIIDTKVNDRINRFFK